MISRTLYLGSAAHIATQFEQLCIRRRSDGLQQKEQRIPIEDIGFIELDSSEITVSLQALNKLASNNVAVMTCGNNHQPTGLYLPISSHSSHTERIRPQLEASQPLRKQLWQSIVRHKIRNQGDAFSAVGGNPVRIHKKISSVRSGDPSNQEGSAAALYWKSFFSGLESVENNFRRDPDGEFPNAFLNYGYAILRAIVARALVSTGLHPSIGLFHKNKYNAFCLADDIMEPYRPFVDILVWRLIQNWKSPDFILTPANKKSILILPSIDTSLNGETLPLMNAVQRTCSSLWNSLDSKQYTQLIFPRLCHIEFQNAESELSKKNENFTNGFAGIE